MVFNPGCEDPYVAGGALQQGLGHGMDWSGNGTARAIEGILGSAWGRVPFRVDVHCLSEACVLPSQGQV